MLRTALTLALTALLASFALAEDQPKTTSQQKAPVDQKELFEQFEKAMHGVKLVGRFTVFGKEEEPTKKEEYTITRVTKLEEGDFWLIHARIKYGDKDVTLPLPLEVKWAGDTPVITLSDLDIPGMGTFTARVLIYRDTYAGFWQHGKVGGHLFGQIEKLAEGKK